MKNVGFLPELDGMIVLLKTPSTSVAGRTQLQLELVYGSLGAGSISRCVREGETQAAEGEKPSPDRTQSVTDPECPSTDLKHLLVQ